MSFPDSGDAGCFLTRGKSSVPQGSSFFWRSKTSRSDTRLPGRSQNCCSKRRCYCRRCSNRIGNSLQIIASILLLKARAVQSEETRMHLQDAHTRVMSVAVVQQQLLASGKRGQIELAPYVMRLCDTLAASMISESRGISLKVDIEPSTVSSTEAISIGLVVTELVINALKHAFPADRPAGLIVVSYEVDETNWRLSVSDNGIGRSEAC